ncbi:phosphotransferase [Roseibacterium sp. SDUM158017]|uniref:aminoglycoside phosphotransferase family protein n=1 Tax=Roseicyclus salinarum TaxID=3036773 RepID=UPI002414E049|nr:phosphotransferase [Roseibacterium sp. SDUM158017]MDG4650276.1 phosphotransferase [Roseibacterium sp. SDUM158017]
MTAAAGMLAQAGWHGSREEPVAADASDRSYVRLVRADGKSAVLMRAPVAASVEARKQYDAFRRIAAWLRGAGLGAPAEIAADPEAGLLLLEDLGRIPLSRLLEDDSPEALPAYRAAVAALARVAAAEAPCGLDRPSPEGMSAMTGITFDQLGGAGTLQATLRDRLAERLAAVCDARPAVALRDVHGDNLMWRPEREGVARIGLLDFQDALILPDGYDLASLVDDPRRVVPASWRKDLIADYAGARGLPEAELSLRVDLLSLQRNIRILGIFRRLAHGMGRPAYARYLPRTRALLLRAAANPGLADLGPLVGDLVDRTAPWQEVAA